MAVAELIRVLQWAMVKGVARGWSSGAYKWVSVTVFNAKAVAAYLSIPASINIISGLQLL